MGAKFSPLLANLYMGWWERTHIFGENNQFMPHLSYPRDFFFVVREQFETLISKLFK